MSSLSIGTGISTSNQVNTTFDYTYNNLGYITNVKKNGTTIASYSYDSLGQLISESNAATGEIYIYTYDKAGNITKKDIYVGDIGNLTDTINYTYGNTTWKDRLTNYDGNAITYDSMGNPTKWVGIAALTWKGRQLTYLSEDGLDHGVAFTYNADGVRTKKVFYDYDGSVTTVYLDADKDNALDSTESSVAYLYASGRLSGINTATTAYTITYDTFGNMVSVSAGGNVLATCDVVVCFKRRASVRLPCVLGMTASRCFFRQRLMLYKHIFTLCYSFPTKLSLYFRAIL